MSDALVRFEREIARLGSVCRHEPLKPVVLQRLAATVMSGSAPEDAFARALRVLDTDEPAHRVLLADLAEWLRLPPAECRRLQRFALLQSHAA